MGKTKASYKSINEYEKTFFPKFTRDKKLEEQLKSDNWGKVSVDKMLRKIKKELSS